MKLIFAPVFALVIGFAFFAAVRWIPYFVRTRMAPFDAMLTLADVTADENVRARLEAQAARRHVWGAVGTGAGYSAGLMASILPDPTVFDDAGALALAGLFVGSAVGQSLSALFPVNPPHGPVRVTAMQPHGMAEYLHRREIAVEIGLAVLGWASVVAGTLALTNRVDIPVSHETGLALVLAGALLGVVATTTLVGQRWLLTAPLRAQDEDQLVAADIVLAVGLRDLFVMTISATPLAASTTWFLPDRAWWLPATFTAAALVSVGAALGVRKRPNLAPVAHRLTARSRTA